MKFYHFFILILSICVISCIPATQEPITKVTLDVNDEKYRSIIGYQDQQNLDSLLLFTSDFNPSYRFLVANALASFQSQKGLDSLYKLLQDPVIKVRTAAAYAIGQIGEESSTQELLSAFKAKDTLDVNNTYNSAILEAIGKIGSAKLLPSLATVSTYRSTDTLLLEGQSRAIYNYALRGIISSEGTDRMVQYLTEPNYPEKVKLIAANYLARTKDLDIETFKFRLTEELAKNANPDIRMAIALALRHTKDNEIFRVLQDQFDIEKDYRVKSNIVRAMAKFPYIKVVEPMLNLLGNKNVHIASNAADYLVNHGNSYDAAIYRNYVNDSLDYRVQAKLYSAILKHIPVYYTNTKAAIKKDILEKLENTNEPYEKAAFIKALGYDPFNVEDIIAKSSDSKHSIVKSAGAMAIENVMTSPNFLKAYRGGHLRKKLEILEIIKSEIAKGDVGVNAVYGELLANESLGLKDKVEDPSFLMTAMKKLNLPKEIETYNSLNKAYCYFSGNKYFAKTPDWNHPINWDIYNTFGDSVQVAIKTEKGVIRTVMYTQEAPGSVANFLTLANQDFYDGKNFHRVVPNFVIQGGCPRGDGYGGENYTIRSELGQIYYDQEGMLGMASAGLHTEGTQWFITHSPAMHLNGKYTIFGRVKEGMDIVHRIEAGDKIEDVIITKL